MSISIKIVNKEGKLLHELEGNDHQSLLEQFEEKGIDFPYSCRAGACYSCAATVLEGEECVDLGKFSVPLIDLEEHQILTCVAGFKDQCCKETNKHTVTLEQFMS